jgi:hypothetical protein
VFKQFKQRLDILTEHLQENAGTDSGADREKVGYIKAVKDLLYMDLETIKES